MNVDVGAVLSRAYHVVARHRVLWALGFLVALLANTGNDNNFRFSNEQIRFFNFDLTPTWPAAMLAIVVGLVIGIAILLLRAVLDAGLIAAGDRSAHEAEPTFREAWDAGRAHIWPMIGLGLIFVGSMVLLVAALVLLGVLAGVGIAGVASTSAPEGWPLLPGLLWGTLGVGSILLVVLLFLAAVPIIAAITVAIQIAQRAVVLEGQSVGQAWSTGWRLMRGNFGPVIGLVLVQIVVNLVVSFFVAAIVATLIGLPALGFAVSGTLDSPAAIVALVMLVGMMWLVAGGLVALPTAWNSVLWTLFYRAATVGLPAATVPRAPYPGQFPPTVPGSYGR